MNPLQEIFRLWVKFSDADRFEEATRHPLKAQEKKLLEIVRRNQDTVYGREHRFDRIRSIGEFQKQVPRNTYETLSPYIDRMTRGEPAVLTADEPVMFATTSGTTGRAKYIPVTPSYLHEYRHGVQVHIYRVVLDYPSVLDGQLLTSSSSDVEGHTPGGLPYGAISGYLARTQAFHVRRMYVLPHAICRVKDIDAKYYLMLRHSLAADVRAIATPNPSSLLLLADKMTRFADELIHDLRTGSVNPALLPPGAPPGLVANLRPDPRRAERLARLLRRSGRLLPAEVWPHLSIISCWKGGTMPLYLRRLPEFFGDCPVRDLGYMASEGRGSTPLVNAGAAGCVAVSSHFFEFVPVDEYDRPMTELITCDRLESDREYYIFFTTSSGLYRYDLHDVVRVVDYYRNTPVIQFVRKGQGITSITGEKLTESQVTTALMEVVEAGKFDVLHFTACVEWADPPHYALYSELGETMTPEQCRRFLERMDRALAAQNIEYESKRDSQRLGPPVLKRVAPGDYQRLRQQRVADGAPEAQVKVPHLSPDMTFGAHMTVIEEARL